MQNREKYLEIIAGMRLMDDDFMCKVFDNEPELVEYLLGIIIPERIFHVKQVKTQYEIKPQSGRSVRLDVFAVDEDGTLCDIEIQREDKGASEKRARFNSSFLDTRELNTGDDFSVMKDTYVIFITENDHFKCGLPIVHIERVIREMDEPFNDGTHIIYVNGSYQSDTDSIGKLMHDFKCSNPDDMHTSPLRNKVAYLKTEDGGLSTMCRAIEQVIEQGKDVWYKEGIEEGMAKGIEEGIAKGMVKGIEEGYDEGQRETIEKFISSGMLTIEQIAVAVNLPLDTVKKIAEEMKQDSGK